MQKNLFLSESTSGATFSPCKLYRYTLWRRWDSGQIFNVIACNPSTADEVKSDPTCTRLQNRAKELGYGCLVVTNIFAFRSTDPAGLRTAGDPVGHDNDAVIVEQAKRAGIVIAAWGIHGAYLDRAAKVLGLLRGIRLHCFGVTQDKLPKHPLYVPYSQKPIIYQMEDHP